jgi:hypothetical protein
VFTSHHPIPSDSVGPLPDAMPPPCDRRDPSESETPVALPASQIPCFRLRPSQFQNPSTGQGTAPTPSPPKSIAISSPESQSGGQSHKVKKRAPHSAQHHHCRPPRAPPLKTERMPCPAPVPSPPRFLATAAAAAAAASQRQHKQLHHPAIVRGVTSSRDARRRDRRPRQGWRAPGPVRRGRCGPSRGGSGRCRGRPRAPSPCALTAFPGRTASR